MENLLTIEEAALRLRVNPETVRRQLRDGRLRGIKRGKWRVPESALLEPMPTVPAAQAKLSPAVQAAQIMDSLQSRDGHTRNAAIIALMRAAPEVRAIVEAVAAKAAEEYYATAAGQDDLADWRALDGEPFHDGGEENAAP